MELIAIVTLPGSSINAMMYQLGAPSDFDEWADIAGPGGESWQIGRAHV